MSVVASLLLFVYAGVNAFAAWAVSRRRSGAAMGFMASAAALVIAAVAVGFGHWAAPVFAALGVAGASWVSAADARATRRRDAPWRHVTRAAFGVAIVGLVMLGGAGRA